MRKQVTEIGYSLCSSSAFMLHPKDIIKLGSSNSQNTGIENCHIYAIASRPRLSFVPGSIDWKNGKTTGKFQFSIDGKKYESIFRLRTKANAESVEVSEYPHTKLYIIKSGKIFSTIPAYFLISGAEFVEHPFLRDLEVLYLGMAYGDGGRSAKDRLLNHSTLQQVLSDMNSENPDLEPMLLMFEFDQPKVLISFDGASGGLHEKRDRDLVADLDQQSISITERLQICLAEAALIRYFEPKYNKIYANSFPSDSHKILDELRAVDMNALTVELNTADLGVRLFSSSRAAGYHHISNYDLVDLKDRNSFFDITNSGSKIMASVFSGPIY